MISFLDGCFALETENTSYLFGLLEGRFLEHYYYGKKIRFRDTDALREKRAFCIGNGVCYNEEHPALALENVCLEMSAYGKGDIREPFVEVRRADGSASLDFRYVSHEILDAPSKPTSVPSAYAETDKGEQLRIVLLDADDKLQLELFYDVYPECDVITRRAVLTNLGKEAVQVNRLMSLQLDFAEGDWNFTSFHGGWAREMNRNIVKVGAGKYVNASFTGTSSSRANPFVMLSEDHTTEEHGNCYGFHLIYSGNHYETVEGNGFGKLRFVSGINPQGFSWKLVAGESLESPEAAMTFSDEGFGEMSAHLHAFVREHIVRGEWKKKVRPVLLNSWEAAYFDIDEGNLLKLAKSAKEVGAELFVMDDGWFGDRKDDTSSLGDWYVNPKKLPGGLKSLCDKVNALGLSFGIWVEPEMVNVKSHLFKTHPDWAIDIPGREHAEGRHQRLLDLCNPEVQEYVIAEMSKVFSSANISYVKWDMNRIFSDVYSKYLGFDRQGEVFHRYVCGLYRCMKELTEKFPKILFEGCSAGGNRFDLGILCYFPQIWASDNTDALCRAELQNNLSLGYPTSVFTSHVSASPNHQTLRRMPLETRFSVAAFGTLGYECNLCDMKKEELAAIREQISLYKEWRDVLQFGTFYRLREFGPCSAISSEGSTGNLMEWMCVSEDKTRAIGMQMQRLAQPNSPFTSFRARGLLEDRLYHFWNRDLKYNLLDFGDLVNSAAPIHVKPDSILHHALAKFVKMDGETENYFAYGDELMYHGVKLHPSFGATGYNDQVKFFPDFGSRMYFCVAEGENETKDVQSN